MDPKEPQGRKNDKLRVSAHYEAMTEKEVNDLTDILASLIMSSVEKEDKE